MIVEHYKSGKKITRSFTVDSGIYEQFQLTHRNMSGWIQDKMEQELLGIDERKELESRIAKRQAEIESDKRLLKVISKKAEIESEEVQAFNDNYEQKVMKAVGIVKTVIENEGEISKKRLKTIAGLNEVDYSEIYDSLDKDTLENKVKNYDASDNRTII